MTTNQLLIHLKKSFPDYDFFICRNVTTNKSKYLMFETPETAGTFCIDIIVNGKNFKRLTIGKDHFETEQTLIIKNYIENILKLEKL